MKEFSRQNLVSAQERISEIGMRVIFSTCVHVEVHISAAVVIMVELFTTSTVVFRKFSTHILVTAFSFYVCVCVLLFSAGFEFPADFMTIVKKIFRTYFAILAHIYYHHFTTIKTLNLNDGLNTLFLHFMYFVQEFKLLESKEWSCMEELLKVLTQVDKDLAKNPPVDEFESLSMQYGAGGQARGQSSRPNRGGGASNPS